MKDTKFGGVIMWNKNELIFDAIGLASSLAILGIMYCGDKIAERRERKKFLKRLTKNQKEVVLQAEKILKRA